MTIQRGKTSPVSNSGSFKSGFNHDPEAALPSAPVAQPLQSFAEFAADIRPEDRASAERAVLHTISNEWDLRWDKVMGHNTRRTAANATQYNEHLRGVLAESPERLARVERLSAQKAEQAAHARAFDAGVPTEYDEYFEGMWAGDIRGFSEESRLKELEVMRKLDVDFRAGLVKPSKVIGAGRKKAKKSAQAWIDRQLVDLTEEIRTRGRSSMVNIRNAVHYRQKADAGTQQA